MSHTSLLGRMRLPVLLLVCVARETRGLVAGVPAAAAARPVRAAPSDSSSELSHLSRSELEALVTALRAENAAFRRSSESTVYQAGFDLSAACGLAGYAFESYNAPSGGRWERGADGCDVAFSSPSFVRECYAGALVVRVVAARGLPGQKDLSEVALTGGKSDPYAMLAVIEAASGHVMERAGNATDVARSSTVWRGGSEATWNESYILFVRDPAVARLAVTVMDENVASDDDVLGAAEIRLSTQTRKHTLHLKADADAKLFDTGAGIAGAAAAAIAGAATAGVGLAAVAAAAVAAKANEKRGQVDLELAYHPFRTDEDVVALCPSLVSSPPRPPVGATEGVDWSVFARDGSYEQLCFVDQRNTGTQAGIWRDSKRRKLLVAFRGTSEPRDIVTDASAAMTQWARDTKRDVDGYDSVPAAVGDPRVHAGFRGALDSIARRLKQLLAVAGDDDWALELTGHSLGGALATLFALDVANGVDPYRALPARPPLGQPWFFDVIGLKTAHRPVTEAAFTPASVSLVTFGAPRAGDLAFSRALDALVPTHFRVVNGQDIVARLPRGFAYVHCGRTVLVDDDPDAPQPLWVEGLHAGDCPLKLTDSARFTRLVSSPLAQGGALADLLDAALNNSRALVQGDPPTQDAPWNPFRFRLPLQGPRPRRHL